MEADPCWQTLDVAVLEPIREKIDEVEVGQRTAYSARIRAAIDTVMQGWEYLPCARKRTVWSYEGTGRTRVYMLYRNPHFTPVPSRS